jgi:hypothetical protein
MAVTAQTILTRVRSQLIDEQPTKRWTDDELLRWLSDGQRTLVAMNPSLGMKMVSIPTQPGTLQVLPPGAFMLLDIQRNMYRNDDDSFTPGREVTVVSRENLDRTDPNWHTSRRSDVTHHFIYDALQPLVYFVWPPSTGVNYLDTNLAMTPVDFDSLDDPMIVEELYQTALFDYVMFRAHQKDTDYSAGNEKAATYLQLFQMFASGHQAGKDAQTPNKGPPDVGQGATS